jgi:hypothetical protein
MTLLLQGPKNARRENLKQRREEWLLRVRMQVYIPKHRQPR